MKSTITFLVLFVTSFLNAQWTNDTAVNTLVATSVSGDMQSIGTSDGKTVVVFWKVVASPTNYELRMQKINADGSQAFGADGVLISNTLPMSTSTNIWSINSDTNDNVYIGVTGTTDQSGHVFKVDPNGTNLWGNAGINLGIGNLVTTKPLSNGEVAVSWLGTLNKAYLQKYTSAGVPIWTTPTTVISGTSKTAPANLFNHTNGDITVVFHTYNTGISSTLWAQRYTSAGVQLWTLPTQLSTTTTAFNRSYSALQDGDIVYFGYYGSVGSRFDSFVQRINADGTLPWGANGKDFDTNQTNYEVDTKIAFAPGSQYIWALANYCNTSQSLYGEYVQKFDKTTGARLFTDTAKELYPINSSFNVHVGREFFLVGDSPLFLLKSGSDNGVSPTTLATVYLNASGDFVFPGQSIPAATFSANKKRIQFNKPVGQAVIAFIEDKGSGDKIYAQRFTDAILETNIPINNNQLLYTNPITNVLDIKSQVNMNAIVVFDTNGKILFTQNEVKSEVFSLNTENWSQGIYFVKITSENALENTLKVIKK
jgi:Secretion system C-terminal sorting domain